jgi:hypothetical protein
MKPGHVHEGGRKFNRLSSRIALTPVRGDSRVKTKGARRFRRAPRRSPVGRAPYWVAPSEAPSTRKPGPMVEERLIFLM